MTEDHGRIEHIAAHPVQAVDATAAGDTFIGYLAAALAAAPDAVPGFCKSSSGCRG